MKKVWIQQRKNRPHGHQVVWYDDSGKQRSKMLPNKALAEQFQARKKVELNSDIYTAPIRTNLAQAVKEYLFYKERVKGLASESLRSISITLEHFREINGPVDSTRIQRKHIDNYIASRLDSVSKATLNKDLRNLKAFINWLKEKRYSVANIKFEMFQVPQPQITVLDNIQTQKLLQAANSYSRAWYIRVLLALTSGLRKGNIEQLKFSKFDFERQTFESFSQKTGKLDPNRPLHPTAQKALQEYRKTLPADQDALFTDKFTSGKWKKIREAAGLPKLKFHDLRKTFASLLILNGYSTSVVQNLLEHSTSHLTHKVYVNTISKNKEAINSISIPTHQVQFDQEPAPSNE